MELSLDLRSYDSEVQAHSHDYHQLVLPVTGVLDMAVEQREGQVGPKQIAVISAGQEHGFSAVGINQFVVADIPAVLAPQLELLPAYVGIDDVLGQYIGFITNNLRSKHHGQGLSQVSERQMLLLLLQLLSERQGVDAAVDARVQKVCQFLHRHLAETITVAQLASLVCLSQRQLNELFRRQMGMSVKQYHIERRMQHAWMLLKQSSLSVAQVAMQVGYQDQAAFSHRFKQHYRCSPIQIRQS